MKEKKRILGIDFGTKRVGVAISDENREFALPLAVVVNTRDLLAEIIKLAIDNEAVEIVIGESRNFKGEPNPIFKDAEEFKKQLEARDFIVYLELEFMTSIQAERIQGKHDKIDASAAALILQSYLDREKNGN
ncbi:MAG: Holliday junction resolvase RuvX [Patescibacteria group bacterium]